MKKIILTLIFALFVNVQGQIDSTTLALIKCSLCMDNLETCGHRLKLREIHISNQADTITKVKKKLKKTSSKLVVKIKWNRIYKGTIVALILVITVLKI